MSEQRTTTTTDGSAGRARTTPTTMGWVGLGTIVLVAFIGQVDMFIVNVAAPGIQRDLGATFGELQFVVNGYIIAYAAVMVLGGRAGDRYGHRTVFNWGVVAFGVTSVLCALAPTASVLIVARVLQGAAAAVMMPQVLSMVHAHFHGPARTRAVGVYGASIGFGVIAGLIGGGLLMAGNIAGLGWRTIFLVNVPICALVLVGSRLRVPQSNSPDPKRLDIVGATLTALLLPAVLVPLALGGPLGWPAWTWACFGAGVVILAILIRHQTVLERGGGAPIIPPSLFARPGFGLCMVLTIVFFAGNAGLFLILTYHLQAGLALGPLATGLVFVPLGAGFALSSAVSQQLGARFGTRVAVAGAALMTVSLAVVPAVTGIPAQMQSWLLAAVLAFSGIGQGLVVAPLVDAVLGLLPAADVGAGSGVLNTMTQAGMATGVAAVGAVYLNVLGTNPEHPAFPLTASAFRSAFDTSVWALVAVAVLTTLLVTRTSRFESSRRGG